MSIPAFEVEDPELETQQRLERRRELNLTWPLVGRTTGRGLTPFFRAFGFPEPNDGADVVRGGRTAGFGPICVGFYAIPNHTAGGPAQRIPQFSPFSEPGRDISRRQSASRFAYSSIHARWRASQSKPQETIVTNTGSPYMPDASIWPSMMDMSPTQFPEMILPACFFPSAMDFDATTIPGATIETASPMGPEEELHWTDMENIQAALSWVSVPGTCVQ
ncbi:hypothetical protein PG994_010720 [Apiospora phragmitis]|uniref:Uncharacterized protein n=1 Tax=Apiospora phragmitis TaxID=2905665 RepID=A0ABR1TQR6_9PEZI